MTTEQRLPKSAAKKFVPNESTSKNSDKVKHYKWRDSGTKGELMWVPKGDLHVDHSYQRDAKDSRSLAIARDWWWMACGTVSVARRADGLLVVFDGQHRVAAAMKRSDITHMPCIVFDSDGVEEESSAFLWMNTGRKPVTAVEKFRSKITSGDEVSVAVEKLVSTSRRRVASNVSPSTIGCIAALEHCSRKNHAALERIFPIALELCEGSPLHKHVVAGLHSIECYHEEDSITISRDPWRSRIISIGFDSLMRSMRNTALARGSNNEAAWAIGIALAVNKGMRTNKLMPEKV